MATGYVQIFLSFGNQPTGSFLHTRSPYQSSFLPPDTERIFIRGRETGSTLGAISRQQASRERVARFPSKAHRQYLIILNAAVLGGDLDDAAKRERLHHRTSDTM
ncbi:MAG: hypothetical protein ALECFALPRED_001293 [Alectoria fallacina]|uniref:Uncharacterized protein n=1 Tax=Alectoria fallacina TaxID=1903189 RepID=A0A8H3I9E7_9LECA|nr:MAG: hypothetical protein ALECFALPRED_001293 [Alectoria fallacina]